MGEQKRRQLLDADYGKPTQFCYKSYAGGVVVKPLNRKPPETNNFLIKVMPLTKIEEVPDSLLNRATREGIKYADFCAPVVVGSVTLEELFIPPVIATIFPCLDKKGMISVDAMYGCGVKTNSGIMSMLTLALVIPLVEAEINYLVATAFKKFLEERPQT